MPKRFHAVDAQDGNLITIELEDSGVLFNIDFFEAV